MMRTLILGASGDTGRHLVNQLLLAGSEVRVVVRSAGKIPGNWKTNPAVEIIEASVNELSVEEMGSYIDGCGAVASCLGHNMSLRGILGKPRRLVKEAVETACSAILTNNPSAKVKLILMNTAGNRNKDLEEKLNRGERLMLSVIRALLPPHADNEEAAEYLRKEIGQKHPQVEWAVVRPDTLINADEPSPYEVYPSPIRSALFNPGKTSRVNVGHFMAQLISDPALWQKWKGQMPVIYNQEEY